MRTAPCASACCITAAALLLTGCSSGEKALDRRLEPYRPWVVSVINTPQGEDFSTPVTVTLRDDTPADTYAAAVRDLVPFSAGGLWLVPGLGGVYVHAVSANGVLICSFVGSDPEPADTAIALRQALAAHGTSLTQTGCFTKNALQATGDRGSLIADTEMVRAAAPTSTVRVTWTDSLPPRGTVDHRWADLDTRFLDAVDAVPAASGYRVDDTGLTIAVPVGQDVDAARAAAAAKTPGLPITVRAGSVDPSVSASMVKAEAVAQAARKLPGVTRATATTGLTLIVDTPQRFPELRRRVRALPGGSEINLELSVYPARDVRYTEAPGDPDHAADAAALASDPQIASLDWFSGRVRVGLAGRGRDAVIASAPVIKPHVPDGVALVVEDNPGKGQGTSARAYLERVERAVNAASLPTDAPEGEVTRAFVEAWNKA